MLLRMLVALDGSPLAERALEMATLLAQRMAHAKPAREPLVILCRVVDPSPLLDLAGEDARTRALDTAAHYLQERAAGLRKEGLTVETAVRLGQPAAELLEQVIARQIDLVLLSTHGRSGLTRWALGSVAERVARSAPVPVLLLPAAAPATLDARDAQGMPMMLRLLVPLDRSARAEAALPSALELARLLQAELRLLSVVVPKLEESKAEAQGRPWNAEGQEVREIERYLQRHAEAAQQAGITVWWGIGFGLPGLTIIEQAHTHQVQLIVMTTQGRGGLGRGRLGSVAEEVLHHGQWPVLLVPSATAATDQPKEDRSPGTGVSDQERDRSAERDHQG
jgi:nucleotide-binding universal stress UspA family protein